MDSTEAHYTDAKLKQDASIAEKQLLQGRRKAALKLAILHNADYPDTDLFETAQRYEEYLDTGR